ncbi:preprotein translocase subunit SecG [Candidatus Endowatersipora endosymbiont of Watersipora subatra]|uniref:preprotein translocase subunit SecG n=1 Tax=Candidatus Endowatersipora endosymbiont of Watersipora subatra TaxID=3077946 RepID=UPI00312C77ED
MQTVLIVVHVTFVLALILLVLLQPSEGGAFTISSGGGFCSARSVSNALTKTTVILAIGFFLTSVSLGILSQSNNRISNIVKQAVSMDSTDLPSEPEQEKKTKEN